MKNKSHSNEKQKNRLRKENERLQQHWLETNACDDIHMSPVGTINLFIIGSSHNLRQHRPKTQCCEGQQKMKRSLQEGITPES